MCKITTGNEIVYALVCCHVLGAACATTDLTIECACVFTGLSGRDGATSGVGTGSWTQTLLALFDGFPCPIMSLSVLTWTDRTFGQYIEEQTMAFLCDFTRFFKTAIIVIPNFFIVGPIFDWTIDNLNIPASLKNDYERKPKNTHGGETKPAHIRYVFKFVYSKHVFVHHESWIEL